jgi:hypothetical protein
MSDGGESSRPWNDERIPFGVNAEGIYHRVVTEGTTRRRTRRRRRAVAGVGFALTLVVAGVLVEADRAATRSELQVNADATTSSTARSDNAVSPNTTAKIQKSSSSSISSTTPAATFPTVIVVTPPTPPQSPRVSATTVPAPTNPRTTTTVRPSAPTTVTFSGGLAAPLVTITGHGFGAEPVGTSDDNTVCGVYVNNGDIYGETTFWLKTPYFAAGSSGACTGINIDTWTNTKIVFGFGSSYHTYDHWYLAPGDSYTISLKGALLTGTVQFT